MLRGLEQLNVLTQQNLSGVGPLSAATASLEAAMLQIMNGRLPLQMTARLANAALPTYSCTASLAPVATTLVGSCNACTGTWQDV